MTWLELNLREYFLEGFYRVFSIHKYLQFYLGLHTEKLIFESG